MSSNEQSTRDREPCADLSAVWNFDDPAASEELFQKRARDERAAGRSQCADQALTQVARALGLQQKFGEGHQVLDELGAEAELQGRVRVYVLLERGRLYNSNREPERAQPLFEQAFDLARAEKFDDLAVDAAHMVAIAVMSQPLQALDWNEKALELAEGSADPRAQRWKGSLYNNIGFTELDLGHYEKALTTFVRLEELRRAEGKTKLALIARWSQGKTLRKMGKTQAALELMQRLLSMYEEARLEPTGYVYEELGECKLELEAAGYQADFRRAYELLSKDPWLVDNEPERLRRLERLSR